MLLASLSSVRALSRYISATNDAAGFAPHSAPAKRRSDSAGRAPAGTSSRSQIAAASTTYSRCASASAPAGTLSAEIDFQTSSRSPPGVPGPSLAAPSASALRCKVGADAWRAALLVAMRAIIRWLLRVVAGARTLDDARV